jgi:hypothetical protein
MLAKVTERLFSELPETVKGFLENHLPFEEASSFHPVAPTMMYLFIGAGLASQYSGLCHGIGAACVSFLVNSDICRTDFFKAAFSSGVLSYFARTSIRLLGLRSTGMPAVRKRRKFVNCLFENVRVSALRFASDVFQLNLALQTDRFWQCNDDRCLS